jgi:hypothetical protein
MPGQDAVQRTRIWRHPSGQTPTHDTTPTIQLTKGTSTYYSHHPEAPAHTRINHPLPELLIEATRRSTETAEAPEATREPGAAGESTPGEPLDRREPEDEAGPEAGGLRNHTQGQASPHESAQE